MAAGAMVAAAMAADVTTAVEAVAPASHTPSRLKRALGCGGGGLGSASGSGSDSGSGGGVSNSSEIVAMVIIAMEAAQCHW